MIGELEFSGYKFFNDNQKISFYADCRIKKLLSNAIDCDNKYVLKSLALYGANNSGKSNIIKLLSMLKLIFLNKDFEGFNFLPFKDKDITDISITFNNGNGWIKYSFSYDNVNKRYIKEKYSLVTYYTNGAPFEKCIFHKDLNARILKIFNEDNSNLIDIISSNRPLLYSLELNKGKYSNLNAYLTEIVNFAKSYEVIKPFNLPLENTISTLKGKDDDKKKFIVNFVKHADVSIDNFEYDNKVVVNKSGKPDEKILNSLPLFEDALHLMTTYKSKKAPSIIFDSYGTKKIQAIASYVYDSIKNGKTLIVDELDNGLHYRLTRAIIGAFNNLANTKGQLLFTSHDLLLINNKNFMRKEQICFAFRDKDDAKLYCLKEATTEATCLRELDNIIKLYNRGTFIPVPTPDFTDDIINVEETVNNDK